MADWWQDGDEPKPQVQSSSTSKKAASKNGDLLPVSLLCGFLGAGKTTLLKHILETKHADGDFKCAVIVNDMAELNIDKDLIDQSALVQTDKVIAMQNGCFCCTLSTDLVEQIIDLASKHTFNYMLIEASGVGEPSQIAPLFDLDDHQHSHEGHDHPPQEGPQLGEVARLDTCVTVIDAAEFYNNLSSMEQYGEDELSSAQGTIAELMMEQVEYSNVVIINKTDLVSKEQQSDILDRISILNPRVKVLKSYQSKIDVMEILNTKLYSKKEMEESNLIMRARAKAKEIEKWNMYEEVEEEKCCKKSQEEGGKKCCKSKSKNGQEIDSGLSTIFLGVNSDNKEMTRHEKRFGITSFIYRARRPFHPWRLYDNFLTPFFIFQGPKEEAETDLDKLQVELQQLQFEAGSKQDKRNQLMGGLMRSKGFIWLATSHNTMGTWQQGGNVIRLNPARPWLCDLKFMWEGTPMEEQVMEEMRQPNGEEWPYGDRIQELVFIGKDLVHEEIQQLLDFCLLTDEEMEMGPSMWAELWEKNEIDFS